MNTPLIALSILDPLYTLFGIIIRFIYQVFNNYGIAIILFTILIRTILLPFNVKQHKSSLQQRMLKPQLMELQRYYGEDKTGYQQAQMELYKQHKVSMFGGCLPAILQLVLIWPVYRIISGPLFYIMQVPKENLENIGTMLIEKGLLQKAAVANVTQMNIPIMQTLHDNAKVFAEVVNQGLMKASDLLDLDFFGLNLGLNPTFSPAQLFGEKMGVYLPLLLFPILATATTILQSWYTQKNMQAQTSKKDKKELESKNPALRGQQTETEDPAAASMKSMKYVMPIMTLFFTFSMPAAMSLYWVVGNVHSIFQTWLFQTIYTKPMEIRQAESDAKYEADILSRAKSESEKIAAEKEETNQKKKRRRRSN